MIMKKIMEEITFLGGVLFYILFSVLFLFQKEYDFFLTLIMGLIIIYLVSLIIRIFYFKPRPKKREYKNFIEKIDASSFPSIHAARATFIFLFLLMNFLKSFYLIFLVLILTLLVFYSRIYLKKHYLIDVLGGILLGIFSLVISLFI